MRGSRLLRCFFSSFWISKIGRSLAVMILAMGVACAIAAETCESLFSKEAELPPPTAILIALGHDNERTHLRHFADAVETEIHRQVATYREFASAHYVQLKGKWWNELTFEKTNATVEQALRKAVGLYPGRQVIIFNLDSFDPKELFAPDGTLVATYTNFEVTLLLKDPKLYAATRWYREGRVLTPKESEEFWKSTLKKLR